MLNTVASQVIYTVWHMQIHIRRTHTQGKISQPIFCFAIINDENITNTQICHSSDQQFGLLNYIVVNVLFLKGFIFVQWEYLPTPVAASTLRAKLMMWAWLNTMTLATFISTSFFCWFQGCCNINVQFKDKFRNVIRSEKFEYSCIPLYLLCADKKEWFVYTT